MLDVNYKIDIKNHPLTGVSIKNNYHLMLWFKEQPLAQHFLLSRTNLEGYGYKRSHDALMGGLVSESSPLHIEEDKKLGNYALYFEFEETINHEKLLPLILLFPQLFTNEIQADLLKALNEALALKPKPYQQVKLEWANRLSFDIGVSTLATLLAQVFVEVPKILAVSALSFFGADLAFQRREKFKHDSYCTLVEAYNNKSEITDDQIDIFKAGVESGHSLSKQLLTAFNPKAWNKANIIPYYAGLGAVQCGDGDLINAMAEKSRKLR